ncbi:MAG: short-chain dehydrogenase [Frankiales bacterium]|nr:short-chain dehydrogenase [Frankiales bacterium]
MDLGLHDRVVLLECADETDRQACAGVLSTEGARVVTSEHRDVDAAVVYLPLVPASSLLEAGLADLRRDWLGLEAVVTTFQSVLPGMTSRGWGRLVTVLSGSVKSLDDESDERGAVVGLAVLGLHKAVVADVARYGITTNAVLRDDHSDPTEVAEAVAFLMSEPAGYLQGVTLALDGARRSSVF